MCWGKKTNKKKHVSWFKTCLSLYLTSPGLLPVVQIFLSGIFKDHILKSNLLQYLWGTKQKQNKKGFFFLLFFKKILQWVLMSDYMCHHATAILLQWHLSVNVLPLASPELKETRGPYYRKAHCIFCFWHQISGWQKPKHQRQLIQENNPQTQHVHVQIPLLSIVCYLSCHSNILLQTVLTNKLQKSQQIDTVCVL